MTPRSLSTDDLIMRLAGDPQPRLGPGGALALAPLAGLALTGLPILAALGVRPDLGAALTDPLRSMKWVLPLAVTVLALPLAWQRARPEARLGTRPLVLALVALLAMGLASSALAALPVAAWGPAVWGSTRFTCLVSVVGMGLGPLVAVLWAFGQGATTAPRLSGLLAGLGAGGLAAALYAVHCDEDEAPFFVIWYGTGILLLGALGALLGPRALRW